MMMRLETDRLTLRSLGPSDLTPEYVNWLNDPEINKYLSCSGKQQTIDSCLAYIKSFDGHDDKALIGLFLKSDNLHIGNITLSYIDWKLKAATIGICIGRKQYNMKGYGKEALAGIINYCFLQLGLKKLKAHLNTNNNISYKLFKSCSFVVDQIVQTGSIIDGLPQFDFIVSLTNNI